MRLRLDTIVFCYFHWQLSVSSDGKYLAACDDEGKVIFYTLTHNLPSAITTNNSNNNVNRPYNNNNNNNNNSNNNNNNNSNNNNNNNNNNGRRLLEMKRERVPSVGHENVSVLLMASKRSWSRPLICELTLER
jgi:hypothetical protein